jgi:hypothetical protein
MVRGIFMPRCLTYQPLQSGADRLICAKAAALAWASLRVDGSRREAMFDLLMLALLVVMFAGAMGYVRACERVTERPGASGSTSK